MSPYPDTASKFPRIELEREGTKSVMDKDVGTDENKEATKSEKNCDLGELPRKNENDVRDID